jgi:outer membrane protein
MKLAFLLTILAAVIWFRGAARAADGPDDGAAYSPPEFLAQPPSLPPGFSEAQALRLDLPQALMIAMQRNLNLSLERKRIQSSDVSAAAAKADMYEPTVTAGVSHNSAGVDSLDLSASQKLPTGGSLSLNMNNARTQPSSGTTGYSSGLSLSLIQPLLRGFSTDLAIPQYSLITAKIENEQQRYQLQITAAGLVAETEAAYWEVVDKLYSYGVTAKSEKAAEDMLDLTRRRIAAGMVASSEITIAENNVAERKVAVLSAVTAIEDAWDTLRTILNLPRDQWDRPLLPTDRPHFQPTVVTSADVALQTALRRRPEIAQAGLDLQTANLALRKAENDRLPQVDLNITASAGGLGTTYRDALSELGRRDNTGLGVTVSLSWTPLQRASKTAVELARIQRELQTMGREQRVQAIWTDVRGAVRRQRAAALQVVASSKSRQLASRSLEIEVRKYQTGATDNLSVTTLQNQLANVELGELQSLIGHEQAAARLLLATGELLEHRHISLEVKPKAKDKARPKDAHARQ